MSTVALEREAPAGGGPRAPSESFLRRAWRRLRRDRAAMLGLALLALIALSAVLAAALAPYDPLEMKVVQRVRPPSAAHWLGTDGFGRDLLSRVLYGGQISMRVGTLAVLFSTAVGVALGLVSGFYPRVDGILMRVMDGLMAFPSIILALAVAAVLGPRELNATIAISVVYAPRTARLIRASVLQIREQEYIQAARSLGAGDLRLLVQHILPNALSPIIVQATFVFAYAVLAEAALSFIGVGPPPPAPSWGNIMAEGKTLLRSAPWVAFFPGLAIMVTVMAVNMVGDALRDVLDPRLKTEQ